MTVKPPGLQPWPLVAERFQGIVQATEAVGLFPDEILSTASIDTAMLYWHDQKIFLDNSEIYIKATRSLMHEVRNRVADIRNLPAPPPYHDDLLLFMSATCKHVTNVFGLMQWFINMAGMWSEDVLFHKTQSYHQIEFKQHDKEEAGIVLLNRLFHMLTMDHLLSWLSGTRLDGMFIEFRNAETLASLIPASLTKRPIVWNASRTALNIPVAIGDLRVIRSSSELDGMFPAAPILFARGPQNPYAAAVVKAIDEAIANERSVPGLADLARGASLSAATLRRRLGDDGTSLQSLKAERRKAWAVAMLHEGRLSFNEIACRLGFADEITFRRAFKKWTGSSPSMIKRQGRAAPLSHSTEP